MKQKRNVIESVIAWENAKRKCKPEEIEARAAAKVKELFGDPERFAARLTDEIMQGMD